MIDGVGGGWREEDRGLKSLENNKKTAAEQFRSIGIFICRLSITRVM